MADFLEKLYSRLVSDPPVKVWVTINQDSSRAKVISGDVSGMQMKYLFQIMGVYQVIPASNNGPIVASGIVKHQEFDITDGYGKLRKSCLLHDVPNNREKCVDGGYKGGNTPDCSQARQGCLLVGGSSSMWPYWHQFRSYPNGRRDVAFEERKWWMGMIVECGSGS